MINTDTSKRRVFLEKMEREEVFFLDLEAGRTFHRGIEEGKYDELAKEADLAKSGERFRG